MLHKLKKMIEGIVNLRPHTATQDKLSPPGNFYNSSSAQLVRRGKVGTTEFKNLLASMAFPHNDSVSGPLRADIIYTRTTPLADTDYASLPKGSLCIFQTVASRAATDGQVFINNIYGYGALMENNRDNIILAIATAAQAAVNGRWAGLRIRCRINGTVDCSSYDQIGLYVETELDNTAKCKHHWGIKVETYVTANATVGDHYGIGVYTYSNVAGTNAITVLRLEHNGAATAQSFISSHGNATSWLDTNCTVTNFLKISAVGKLGSSANSTGESWTHALLVKIQGLTRYIKLSSA